MARTSKPVPIAITGLGGIFPGAQDPQQLWNNIVARRDEAREPPQGRWSVDPGKVYSSFPAPDKVGSKRACFVDPITPDLDGLEIDPALVAELDPMFALLLHAGRQAWQATNTDRLDRKRTGVIIGNIALPTDTSSRIADELLGSLIDKQLSGQSTKGRTHLLNRYVAGLPATLLARALGLGGTSYTLDAACASSLYSLKYAVDELRAGRADSMLCGGLSRPDSLYTQMGFSTLGAISPSGRCSPFDRKADGLVVGEGCGILVLKRLDDALRDGDTIQAVIAGIGISNDIRGNLMLPDSEGQLRAMRAAYTQAGWQPDDVDLIECHGTGTPAGDQTEYRSLRTLWGEDYRGGHRAVIGSVKSNIGHLLTAAGSAGLMKVLMAFRHETLPPMANFEQAASGIDLDNGSFEVLGQARPWPQRGKDQPRRAAVSAFGFGGINAHVLLEQWNEPSRKPGRRKKAPAPALLPAIAIVGMDACFGPWRTLTDFTRRVLGDGDNTAAQTTNNRWGEPRLSGLPGYTIDKVEIPLGRFRIPPKELEDMLPQQLLMLQVAANAIEDAKLTGLTEQERIDAGVFIGIGLDLNTTNFHLRWTMAERARDLAQHSGRDPDTPEIRDWIHQLCDTISPALSANRTMGALGGIVASRIARAFNLGGAGFTVSSEENSALHALQTAVRSLQQHELNLAIVGAVDLAGDARAVAGQAVMYPYSNDGICRPFASDANGSVIGEGAAALVLKRHEDAVRDGDRVYAVISGMGTAGGGDTESMQPTVAACAESMRQACADARIETRDIDFIETHGSGDPEQDRIETGALCSLFDDNRDPHRQPLTLASVKADIGHAGAASALASVARAALALHHRVLPPLRTVTLADTALGVYPQFIAHTTPRYWLRDRTLGPRRALVASMATGGNCAHVVIEQAGAESITSGASGQNTEQLFSIEGNTRADLGAALDRLAQQAVGEDLTGQACRWYREQCNQPRAQRAISLVASSSTQLRELIAQSRSIIDGGRVPISDRIYYADEPLAGPGRIAFVFPGSGNHFRGMGRDIALRWPQVLERLDVENDQLASQFAQARFWSDRDEQYTHQEVIFGQVWLGTFISDVITNFGVNPDAVIGYSLGETAGLFATRTWRARDLMLQRIQESTLFTTELAGPCNAARQYWGLSNYVDVDWQVGVIQCPADRVKARTEQLPWVYLLIVNTPEECVIGGHRIAVESLVKELGCQFHPVETITTVHCEIAQSVAKPYRDLHLFPTTPPAGVKFYSGILGRSYEVSMDSAADSIVGQAVQHFDYTKVIDTAWNDGVRLFIEMGPGASCTRMIDRILQDRPHAAHAVCVNGRNGVTSFLRTLALLNSHRVELDLSSLYQEPAETAVRTPSVSVTVGHTPVEVRLPDVKKQSETASPVMTANNVTSLTMRSPVVSVTTPTNELLDQMIRTEAAMAGAHETYLRVANGITQTLSSALSLQLGLLQSGATAQITNMPRSFTPVQPATRQVALDREQCLEFAIGSIEKMLGPQFSGIDQYPTRVRLPDEPLMLVDRIIEVEGEACSLTHGRVVTEHDIHPGAWYLDGGCIPTCIAVEAGQADLFLSGYLGIDHITKGLAVYRLLDAEITFHAGLPGAGKTIHYDIYIDRFFRQGDTHLFRFRFEGTVDGKPLLTMKNGCAGFFTQTELDAGKGIVLTELERRAQNGVVTGDWQALVPMQRESYTDQQIDALRRGDLAGCFGPRFSNPDLQQPAGLPGGRMTLVHRVLDLDPAGGRYGLGIITGEADIHPDDWFLTCHFIDDQVMPGTLMYECCLHTLRIYLLRLGWVGETDQVVYEPVPGVTGKLKCRGQVIASTRKVQYEITLKEIGYDPVGTPYAIADAMMSADGRAIVQMTNMSLRLSGLNKNRLEALWQGKQSTAAAASRQVLFDYESILAFATGKPSEAFGDRYLPFDNDRIIARLPGPPFQFLDRIVSIEHCDPWQLKAGGVIEAEYDVPEEAWYFAANRQTGMPFSVLLEIALQPCGWLAAYLGSALTSTTDLSFRNLGGKAVQRINVTPDTGTLTTRVKITNVANSGGMIIQNFDYEVRCSQGVVYKGDTYFGFFSKQALANQIGIRDVIPYQPTPTESTRATRFEYPQMAPYPDTQMRMVDTIAEFIADGGPHGLGYIRGTARVNPDAWFFKAHFYQDPVWPGSLGLESFIQLLKVMACERWPEVSRSAQFESMALNCTHQWLYRGQIIPKDREVTVMAVIKQVNNADKLLIADGFLVVDGRIIYQMTDFALRMLSL